MKFNGVFAIVVGTLLLLSTLGLFKASVNLVLIILAILLIISGFNTFLKENNMNNKKIN